jgi:transposase
MNLTSNPRRKYDKEFKMEAVRLALRGDRSKQSIAESLGICTSNLQRWIREYKASGKGAFPGKGNLKPEDEELHRLKREMAIIKEERDILKKALAVFSRGH